MRSIVSIMCFACACHGPPRRELVFGLDATAPGCTPDARALERAAEAVRDRLDAGGERDPKVYIDDGTVIASLSPDLDEDVVALLPNILTRHATLAIDRFADDPQSATSGDHVARWLKQDGPGRSLTTTGVTGAAIDRVRVIYATPDAPAVKIELTPDGARRMAALAGEHIAIVLDGVIRGDFVLPRQIGNTVTLVTVGATEDDRARNAFDMTNILKVGAVTCPLVLRHAPPT